MEVLAFLSQYKYIILFYLAIIIFLIIKRKDIDRQAKIIFLYRRKWGIVWMNRVASRFREWIILAGYVGVGVGFVGLALISYVLIKGLVDLVSKPALPANVSIVLPGMNIPGLGILPFWEWIIAIFIIAVVHEFSHGILARAHNIEVKNTGIVFFGPILGAFVEPDEKRLMKDKDISQYSVLAAGSFSNILLGILSLVLLLAVFGPLHQAMVDPQGFSFSAYTNEELPAAKAGIPLGSTVSHVDGKEVKGFMEFHQAMSCSKAGDKVTLTANGKEYPVTLADSPDEPGNGYLGIMNFKDEVQPQEEFASGVGGVAYKIVRWLMSLFKWLYVLSLGIGLFNLLPLPIVDGGRMAQVFLHKLKGPEAGEKRYRLVSLFFLLVLLLNLVLPFVM